jgi:hypothetical protein
MNLIQIEWSIPSKPTPGLYRIRYRGTRRINLEKQGGSVDFKEETESFEIKS